MDRNDGLQKKEMAASGVDELSCIAIDATENINDHGLRLQWPYVSELGLIKLQLKDNGDLFS